MGKGLLPLLSLPFHVGFFEFQQGCSNVNKVIYLYIYLLQNELKLLSILLKAVSEIKVMLLNVLDLFRNADILEKWPGPCMDEHTLFYC